MAEERDVLEIDVLFVGAGPASLAGAYQLAKLIEEHNEKGEGESIEIEIGVLEKGQVIGAHALSGAVVDTLAFAELLPDCWQEAPFEGVVEKESFLYLSEKRPSRCRCHRRSTTAASGWHRWVS